MECSTQPNMDITPAPFSRCGISCAHWHTQAAGHQEITEGALQKSRGSSINAITVTLHLKSTLSADSL